MNRTYRRKELSFFRAVEENMIDEYFKELHIPEPYCMVELYTLLEDEIGPDDCMLLSILLCNRYEEGERDSVIYDLMNKTFKGSITFFGGFDSAYLRKIFKLIEKYKDSFGKEILDVGCNNGIITCFIAKCCPESHVVGIDIEWSGIKIARQLAEKLNLTNVEFQLKDFLKLEHGQYDTIFMSKSIDEIEGFVIEDIIIEDLMFNRTFTMGKERDQLIEKWRKIYNNISRRVAMNLKENGIFFSLENIDSNIIRYGYCLALNDNELHPDMFIYHEINYCGVEEFYNMPFIFARHMPGDTYDIDNIFTAIIDEEEQWFEIQEEPEYNTSPERTHYDNIYL